MVYFGKCSVYTWKECILCCYWVECSISVRSDWFIMLFRFCVSLLSFCSCSANERGYWNFQLHSVRSVAQSCPTVCNPTNRSTLGLPVHQQLPEFTQTHVCWIVMPSSHLILCHPAISFSAIPFSCPQSFPASGSFQMSQLFTSGGQSIGVSASTSVLPMNTQDWSPSGWTGWISLQSKGLSIVFSKTTVQKHQFFSTQLSSQSNSHNHTWLLEKP